MESSQRGEYTTGPTLLRLNFHLDYMISQSKKPFITFIDGFTFGGGSGLSMFSQYPICSERTLWGMPEVQIGYFPDCGSSYLFTKKITGGKPWGTILALRGQLLQSQVTWISSNCSCTTLSRSALVICKDCTTFCPV